jgi:hypothetical protein
MTDLETFLGILKHAGIILKHAGITPKIGEADGAKIVGVKDTLFFFHDPDSGGDGSLFDVKKVDPV